MYNTPVEPKTPLQVSVTQLIMAVGIVVASLILPIYAIESNKHTSKPVYTAQALNTGRVAGAATEPYYVWIPIVGSRINLNSEAGVLTVAGFTLLGIALILIVYLLLTSNRSAHKSKTVHQTI